MMRHIQECCCYSKWIEGGRCDEGYKDGKELCLQFYSLGSLGFCYIVILKCKLGLIRCVKLTHIFVRTQMMVIVVF